VQKAKIKKKSEKFCRILQEIRKNGVVKPKVENQNFLIFFKKGVDIFEFS